MILFTVIAWLTALLIRFCTLLFFTFAFDQFHLWYAPELMEFQAFKCWRFIWQTIFSASSFSHFHVVEWGRKNALKISCGVFSFLFFIECASFISWEFVSNWTSERAEVQWFIIHASWCASSELLTLHPCNEFHLRDIRLWIYDFIRSMNASSCQHWEVGLNTQTLLPKWKFICHIGRKNGKCWEYSSLLNIMLSLSLSLGSWIFRESRNISTFETKNKKTPSQWCIRAAVENFVDISNGA